MRALKFLPLATLTCVLTLFAFSVMAQTTNTINGTFLDLRIASEETTTLLGENIGSFVTLIGEDDPEAPHLLNATYYPVANLGAQTTMLLLPNRATCIRAGSNILRTIIMTTKNADDEGIRRHQNAFYTNVLDVVNFSHTVSISCETMPKG